MADNFFQFKLKTKFQIHARLFWHWLFSFSFFSDGWADRKDVVQELEEEAWGGISLRIRSPPVKDFDTYFKALRPRTNTRNPWFDEFWEDRFNCSLNESDTTRDPCTGSYIRFHDNKTQSSEQARPPLIAPPLWARWQFIGARRHHKCHNHK